MHSTNRYRLRSGRSQVEVEPKEGWFENKKKKRPKTNFITGIADPRHGRRVQSEFIQFALREAEEQVDVFFLVEDYAQKFKLGYETESQAQQLTAPQN